MGGPKSHATHAFRMLQDDIVALEVTNFHGDPLAFALKNLMLHKRTVITHRLPYAGRQGIHRTSHFFKHADPEIKV